MEGAHASGAVGEGAPAGGHELGLRVDVVEEVGGLSGELDVGVDFGRLLDGAPGDVGLVEHLPELDFALVALEEFAAAVEAGGEVVLGDALGLSDAGEDEVEVHALGEEGVDDVVEVPDEDGVVAPADVDAEDAQSDLCHGLGCLADGLRGHDEGGEVGDGAEVEALGVDALMGGAGGLEVGEGAGVGLRRVAVGGDGDGGVVGAEGGGDGDASEVGGGAAGDGEGAREGPVVGLAGAVGELSGDGEGDVLGGGVGEGGADALGGAFGGDDLGDVAGVELEVEGLQGGA